MSLHVLDIDTVIVGAGQAGLSMSYYLTQHGVEHIILERARVGERWRTERWDSLRFQFPNRYVRLPGFEYDGDEPDVFTDSHGIVSAIERYAHHIKAPVRCGINVRSIEQTDGGEFTIDAKELKLRALNVVLATGPYQRTLIPPSSMQLPPHIMQLTASGYTNAQALPAGAVLVVGAGGSGVQIAEDLISAGRDTWLAAGRHKRIPRRYRGRDIMDWMEDLGLTSQPNPDRQTGDPNPLLTGVDGGYEVDLRRLVAAGGHLLGRFEGVRNNELLFGDQLLNDIAAGDESYVEAVAGIEAVISERGLAADSQPEPPTTLGAMPEPPPLSLDIEQTKISSVIWATGYGVDFSWVRCGDYNADGTPVQERGVGSVPGLYYLGLAFMHAARSSFFWGVGDDASYIADHIARRGT